MLKPNVRQTKPVSSLVSVSQRWPDLSHRKERAKTLKAYFSLTKPGIVVGNGITTLAGFFLATKGDIHVALLLATGTGVSLVIASGYVFNTCIDTESMQVLKRTQSRLLVTGAVPPYSSAHKH